MSWDHCTAIIDGEECGKEECATVHMVSSETGGGHDFKE